MKDWEEQLFLLSSLSFSLSYRLDGAERQGGTGIKRKRKIKNKEKDGGRGKGVRRGFEGLEIHSEGGAGGPAAEDVAAIGFDVVVFDTGDKFQIIAAEEVVDS